MLTFQIAAHSAAGEYAGDHRKKHRQYGVEIFVVLILGPHVCVDHGPIPADQTLADLLRRDVVNGSNAIVSQAD